MAHPRPASQAKEIADEFAVDRELSASRTATDGEIAHVDAVFANR
jgi:hypothetical protein